MKEYTAKTVEEAVKLASEELGIEENDVIFTISNEKKGLLSKKASIVVYELSDAIEFAEEYVKNVIESLGIGDVKVKSSLEDNIIRLTSSVCQYHKFNISCMSISYRVIR